MLKHNDRTWRRLFYSAGLWWFVALVGTFGYMLLEGWTFADSIYMTVITMSTVGFGEVAPIDMPGRILTVILIFASLTFGTYALGTFTSFLVGGAVLDVLRGNRMEKRIHKLKNHIILAGYGKLGHHVALELKQSRTDFCIVEKDTDSAIAAQNHGFLVINGDATSDDILKEAGIERAQGMIAALTGDAANVLVTITAKTLNPILYIVSRGNEEDSIPILQRAGADRVVLPFEIGGRRMATQVTKPGFVDFIDHVTRSFGHKFSLEEILVEPGSKLSNTTIAESEFRNETDGAMIMAIKHAVNKITLHPRGDQVMRPGDKLLVFCDEEQHERIKKLFVV